MRKRSMVQTFALGASGTIRRAACLLLGLICLAPIASAQSPTSGAYPTRPVRLLLGFAPGGATDVVARILQQSISEHLGQQLVIENRPGASGMIATQELVRSAPDGYTLAIIVSAHAGMAALQRNLPFDPIRDIAPVTLVIHMPALVAVPAKSPVQNLQDLVALARATPAGLPIPPLAPAAGRNLA
jgi:tripartite-type tricarboxylate transporter receptor subunit TctC